MDLSRLQSVYEHEGPFATVYLEGRSPAEDAPTQVRLRWRALRERLEQAGATARPLDALESELSEGRAGETQANGRVLVATDSGVLLREPWDAALGAGDDAYWGELPELGAYVREEARAMRTLVVITNQHGAHVRQEVVAQQHDPREINAESVEGSAVAGVHKPREGALSHNQIQRRADEAVSRNAKDIVEHLHFAARKFRPRVLVLAGEVQGRTAIREELPSVLSGILVETDWGGGGDQISEETLTEELLRIASEESERGAEQRTEELQKGLAHGEAVQGADSVAQAAARGAVDTLLFEDGRRTADEASLLQASVKTGSAFALIASGTELTDGVGALLRFALPS